VANPGAWMLVRRCLSSCCDAARAGKSRNGIGLFDFVNPAAHMADLSCKHAHMAKEEEEEEEGCVQLAHVYALLVQLSQPVHMSYHLSSSRHDVQQSLPMLLYPRNFDAHLIASGPQYQ
jgi:hypothetical protein